MTPDLQKIRARRFALLCSVFVAVAACGKPQPLGDANAVIVAVPEAQWAQIGADVESALEPRAFTVRDERIFRVTPVDPAGPYWNDTRRFRQVLLIGEPADEWIAEALREAGEQPTALPTIVQTNNVWARGQRVTAIVLQPGAPVSTAQPLLQTVGDGLLQEYQSFIRQRMFASGADTRRADSLARHEGFYLMMPSVYRASRLDPQTHQFMNDQPDPAQLQRSILVTSRPTAEVDASSSGILAWREEVATRFYQPSQLTQRDRVEESRFEAGAAQALQLHGVWSSPPGAWPAAGPFLARAIACPDGRTYLVDAWVYAPGREKYEYLFQLYAILDSFRCADQREA